MNPKLLSLSLAGLMATDRRPTAVRADRECQCGGIGRHTGFKIPRP
jgi:hypothetical protein